MKVKAFRLAAATVFALFSLTFLTACFCWPSLPELFHRGSCARIQYAASGGTQSVSLPPKNFIAYVHDGDIWIMDPDGSNKKQLTKTAEREFSLSASNQTERIWFVRQSDSSAGESAGDVYSCDYMGKNVKKVTAGIPVSFATVSVDGKRMGVSVVSTVQQTAPQSSYETNDMWLMSAVGKNLGMNADHVNLTGDLPASAVGGREGSTFLAWSPQNDRVAFTYKADGSASLGISTKSVYLAKADGTGRKKLIDSSAEPRFDIQGTALALTTGAHWDTMGVLQVSVDGEFSEEVLPVATGATLYSAATPFWVTTYEDIKENPNVVFAKTTHPASPAPPVNTMEIRKLGTTGTKTLVSMEGADKAIINAWPNNSNNGIVFQVGFDAATASIWSVTPEGKDLKRLSGSDTAGDSEPTSAVSYHWYGNGGASGKTLFQTCHWPYQNN